jgi:hypothetical protein
MPATKSAWTNPGAHTPVAMEHIHRHSDGSIWGRGQTIDGVPTGYWEWYRKDATRMRSGHFDRGVQVGEWTTYDQRGAVYKVTVMKPKATTAATPGKASKAAKRSTPAKASKAPKAATAATAATPAKAAKAANAAKASRSAKPRTSPAKARSR